MTDILTATATTPSTASATGATTTGTGFLTSSLVVAKRTLLAFARTPQLLFVATIQGAMFLLIFRYVFGGAIGTSDGVSYVDFLVPGFVLTGVLFSGMGAAAGVAEDVQRGVVDRFRSLPIPGPHSPPAARGRNDARRLGCRRHLGDRLGDRLPPRRLGARLAHRPRFVRAVWLRLHLAVHRHRTGVRLGPGRAGHVAARVPTRSCPAPTWRWTRCRAGCSRSPATSR